MVVDGEDGGQRHCVGHSSSCQSLPWLSCGKSVPGGGISSRSPTRSFYPCPKLRATLPPPSSRILQRNLYSALILPTRHSQSKYQRNFDDEPCSPTAISPLQVAGAHPPTRRRSLSCPVAHPAASKHSRKQTPAHMGIPFMGAGAGHTQAIEVSLSMIFSV